jgi:uncharacterized protein
MTNVCNLGCNYCYTGSAFFNQSTQKEVNENFKKSLPILFKFLDSLFVYNNYEQTKCIFHGGEPLLISNENWEVLFRYIKSKSYPLIPAIQTNATLINDDFLKMFIDNKFEVGISLDGNQNTNDKTRPFKNGKSSFSVVRENIEKLKKNGVRFGALVTLNKYNVNEINNLYYFFKDFNIPFSIRPIFQSQYTDNYEFQIQPLEYSDAFCELFDLWFHDESSDFSSISEFSSIIIQFIQPIEGLVSCNFNKNCSEHFISFELDGKVTPCNRFHGIKNFVYGNIQNNTLEELLNNQISKPLHKRWDILKSNECKDCVVKELCFGGCPANSFSLKNDYFKKDYYCEAYKKIYQHVNDAINVAINQK